MAVISLLPAALLALAQPGVAVVFKSPAAASNAEVPYFWPSGRGGVGSYLASPYPAQISSRPSWSWHHEDGLWGTIPVGTNIDSQQNIYLTAQDGLRKFSPDGQLLWTYLRRETGPDAYETITKVAALHRGAAFCVTSRGRVFAVSMDTGRELWSTAAGAGSDGNYGHVAADGGVVITAVDVSSKTNRKTPSCCGSMNHNVVGLNATDGSILWKYTPSIPIWNFGASFVGDGTFIFQDLEGRVHRNRASDGSLVWKSGGIPESWTDGQANLGPNGIVYGVANYGMVGPAVKGCLSAYSIDDGKMLWRYDLPTSPNSVPAVGHVAGSSSLSVVMPVGLNDLIGARIDVYALEADTGKLVWTFQGPRQIVPMGLGDANLAAQVSRHQHHISGMTLPNSWGCPAIDGDGKVYVGGTTGHLFRLEDKNGDGVVSGNDEVFTFSTDADFVGSSGPALAPGELAVANANSLFVWRY